MKMRIVLLALLLSGLLPGILWADPLTLTSPQLTAGGRVGETQVFNGFGCSGENVSPMLKWSHAPAGTKSFALTVYDPDAPTGSGWWHWVIFNIPATVTHLSENAGNPDAGAAPAGSIQSMTDFGRSGYGGPCPPQGDKPHRYLFTLFALDTETLPLDASAPGAMAGFYINSHAIGKATVTVLYSR